MMPRRGTWEFCEECEGRVYRKRTERGRRVYCSQACYGAARKREAKSYPKIGGRHAHRVMAEAALGRPLQPGEVVHHVDEDKRNFAGENLDVLPSQADHARHHFTGRRQSPEQVRKRVEARLRTLAARR